MSNDGPILFVSHKKKQCGVYQFGLTVSTSLAASRKFAFRYLECDDTDSLRSAVQTERPAAIIYNHHPSTMPWLSREVMRPFQVPHIGVMHENTQALADAADDRLFDFHVAPDPTLLLRNPIVFKTGRLVPMHAVVDTEPSVPTIGSFGFGTHGKGFDRLIAKVQQDFDQATIRLRIPYSSFFDADGSHARALGDRCRSLLSKPGISLELHHDFLSEEDLVGFLAGNSLNAFLYEDQTGRGISSVIDLALAARRPLAVSKSSMFRHVHGTLPPITVEDSRLSEILDRGFQPIAHYADEWTAENLVWDYERIVGTILRVPGGVQRSYWHPGDAGVIRRAARTSRRILDRWGTVSRTAEASLRASKLGKVMVRIARRRPVLKALLGSVRRRLTASPVEAEVTDTRGRRSVPRYRSDGEEPWTFNRVLDGGTSDLANATAYLASEVGVKPREVPRDRVEAAFFLEAISRLTQHQAHPLILAVGSHGHSATEALSRSGYRMEEIDPIVNYDLDTYLTKPSRRPANFDLAFGAGWIGRAENDLRCLAQTQALLRRGGVGVLTFLLDDGANRRPRGRHSASRERVYRAQHVLDRWLPALSHCELVGAPNWQSGSGEWASSDSWPKVATLVFRRIRI